MSAAELTYAPAGGNDAVRTQRAAVERAIVERDGCRCCFYCGQENARTLEHVTPRGRHGGSDHLENLVLSCRTCNCLKGDTPGWFFVIWKWANRPGCEPRLRYGS